MRSFSRIFYFFVIFFFAGFNVKAVEPIWGYENPLSSKKQPVSQSIWGWQHPIDEKVEENSETTQYIWEINAVSVPDYPVGSPMIAIVIDDLGISKERTERTINLPAPLTASFLAYADNLLKQTAAAKRGGHELLVHTPMEPMNEKNDAGPGALTTEMDKEEILDRLNLMLASFPGYVGINNHMGSRFTSNEEKMRIVLEELQKRGLLFLDSLTSKKSTGRELARRLEVPHTVRNVFIDHTREKDRVEKQLELLEAYARKHKTAVGIGHPHPVTLDALEKWIPEAKERGFVFVPISKIVRYQNQQGIKADGLDALNRHDEWD